MRMSPKPPSNDQKSAPDWESIELDYRAGVKTLRQIAAENGITHGSINKRAKRDGWERDLAAKIQAKADALVSKSLVSTQVSTESRIQEQAVVDAAAQAIADVRLSHRADIRRAKGITNALLSELEQQTDPATLDLLRELGDIMRSPDASGNDRLNDLYRRVIDLSERSKTMKTLAESLRSLIDMERVAFGMDKDHGEKSDPLKALLARISAAGSTFGVVAHDPDYDED